MGFAQDLVNAGYGGYQGWDDAGAEADFKATGGAGKRTSGGGGGGFSFDFAEEAKKAYGELGAYYDRILREAKGDVNMAISRLDEDYARGERYKKQNIAVELDAVETQRKQALKSNVANAQSRGIYGKSSFAEGFGLADENKANILDAFGKREEGIQTDLTRFMEGNKIERERKVTDLKTNMERREFDLEQQRRKEASELANIRGDRAYRKFSSELV